jgi:hypothetical protein
MKTWTFHFDFGVQVFIHGITIVLNINYIKHKVIKFKIFNLEFTLPILGWPKSSYL